MNIKLKNILVALSIFALTGIFLLVFKTSATTDYPCTADGVAQMSAELDGITQQIAKCSNASCFQSLRDRMVFLSQKLQTCGAEAEEKKEDLSKETKTLKWKVNYLNASISQKNAQIYADDTEITILQSQVNSLNQQIKTIEEETKRNKEELGSGIKNIYEYDKQNIIKITLTQENLSSIVDEFTYIESVQKEIVSNLGLIRENKKTLEQKKEEASKSLTNIQQKRDAINKEKMILEMDKLEKNNLLNITKGDEAKYEKIMSEVEKQTKEIYEQIYILEQKINPGSSCSPGSLTWPCGNSSFLTQSYGCLHTSFARGSYPSCDGGQGGFHNGIDISLGSNDCGTPIKAPANGTVIANGDMGGAAYGKWMAIRHDNGAYTLYAHLMSQLASGRVSEGQTIAQMGTTGYSTGCHLHFMVGTSFTQSGSLPIMGHQNPLCYLR